VLAVLSLVAVAAGCSSSDKPGPSAAAAVDAVPWVATRPAALVQAERTTTAAPCRASSLAISGVVQFTPNGQSGGGLAFVPIRNIGTRPCSLTGRPTVRMVKRGGPQQQIVPIAEIPPQWPGVSLPASMLRSVRPDEAAALAVEWTNWCDFPVKGKPHVPPSALRVTLPHGRGSISADYNAVPQCVEPKEPSQIAVGPFQPATVPVGQPFTSAVLRASFSEQPLHARRGDVLDYRVVLRNASQTPASFETCPSYVQLLAPAGHIEAYKTNCRAAHPIVPGKPLVLDMRLRVPKKAPLGPNGLFWELDPFGGQQPQANGRVIVDG
jgi:uncharacterized protein DUF4232